MFLNYLVAACLACLIVKPTLLAVSEDTLPACNWLCDLRRTGINFLKNWGGTSSNPWHLFVCWWGHSSQETTEQTSTGGSGGSKSECAYTACSCYIGCVDHPSLLSITHWQYRQSMANSYHHLNPVIITDIMFVFQSPPSDHQMSDDCCVVWWSSWWNSYNAVQFSTFYVVMFRWGGQQLHCYNCHPPINPRIGISGDNLTE